MRAGARGPGAEASRLYSVLECTDDYEAKMDYSTLSSMPSIVLVMTPFPYSIELDDRLSRAEEMMKSHGVHHLPVRENGRLVGVLSASEIERRQRDAASLPNPSDVLDTPVGDCRLDEAHIVDRSHPLDLVLSEMASRHLASVLVTKRDKLVGIFSTTDAHRALIDILRAKFPSSGGEAA